MSLRDILLRVRRGTTTDSDADELQSVIGCLALLATIGLLVTIFVLIILMSLF